MSEPLKLQTVVGFGGLVQNGLLYHPDGKTIIYSLGSTVVVRNKDSVEDQQFLQGHTDRVSSAKGGIQCELFTEWVEASGT